MPEAKYCPYAESNDEPQNIGYGERSNASELVQNTFKTLKEYWLLHLVGYNVLDCIIITWRPFLYIISSFLRN